MATMYLPGPALVHGSTRSGTENIGERLSLTWGFHGHISAEIWVLHLCDKCRDDVRPSVLSVVPDALRGKGFVPRECSARGEIMGFVR